MGRLTRQFIDGSRLEHKRDKGCHSRPGLLIFESLDKDLIMPSINLLNISLPVFNLEEGRICSELLLLLVEWRGVFLEDALPRQHHQGDAAASVIDFIDDQAI